MVLSRSLMSSAQKFSYAGFLCLSVVMVIMALIRLIGTLITTKPTNRGSSPIWGTFWEMMEACIAVIMACFLTFRAAVLNHATSENPASRQNKATRGPASLWDRLLLTFGFRTSSRNTPNELGEQGAPTGLDQYNTQAAGRKSRKDYILPTLNMTRPRLAFSRLPTLFGSADRTIFASEASLVTRGTINVETEFDLQELDYHEVRRREAPWSTEVSRFFT